MSATWTKGILGPFREAGVSGETGTIRLGASPTWWPHFPPHVAGRHDLGRAQLLVRSGDPASARLFREPLKLAVARDRPLAGRGAVGEGDLAGLDIPAPPPGYPAAQPDRGAVRGGGGRGCGRIARGRAWMRCGT